MRGVVPRLAVTEVALEGVVGRVRQSTTEPKSATLCCHRHLQPAPQRRGPADPAGRVPAGGVRRPDVGRLWSVEPSAPNAATDPRPALRRPRLRPVGCGGPAAGWAPWGRQGPVGPMRSPEVHRVRSGKAHGGSGRGQGVPMAFSWQARRALVGPAWPMGEVVEGRGAQLAFWQGGGGRPCGSVGD